MSHVLLQQVLEFHKKYKKHIGDPRFPRVHDVDFRMRLIDEEYEELEDALDNPVYTDRQRIIKIADALGDLAYVIFGAAVTFGIDLASVLDAIHASNMTKDLDNARADGKVTKGHDYKPPEIEQALECAAYECDRDGFDEEDSWWPKPSLPGVGVDFMPGFNVETEEPPAEVTDKVMLAAREQAKLLAMKSISDDFVTDVEEDEIEVDEDEITQVWEDDDLSEPTEEGFKAVEQCLGCSDCAMGGSGTDCKPGNYPSDGVPEGIQGEMTNYGCYIFQCPCGRTHGMQAKLGSRGGMAPSATTACMCGKAFVGDFTGKRPVITVTTIEELRKAENV